MHSRTRSSRRHLRALRREMPAPGGARRLLRGLLILLVLAGLGTVAYLFYAAKPPSLETVSLTLGTVEVTAEAEALMVRQERLAAAPATGTVRRLVEEGTRVRVGTPVAVVQSDGGRAVEVKAEVSGAVSFQVDGLEAQLNPSRMDGWTPDWFRALPLPSLRRTGEGTVTAGEPLFKIADTFQPGLVTVVRADAIPPLEVGADLRLRLTGREGVIVARVARVERSGEEILLYLSPQLLPEETGGVRRVRLTLLVQEFQGKVAPRTAIDVRNGLQGVWSMEGAGLVFTPVKVTGGNLSQVVMETALPPGTAILKDAPVRMD